MTTSWPDNPPDDCDAPESHPDGCACVSPAEETVQPMTTPEVDAVIRRAIAGGRWMSPAGDEVVARGVEQVGDPVYLCGMLVGVQARSVEIVWADGTKTDARVVAHPRSGWVTALEEER